MISNQEKISPWQIAMIVYKAAFGAGVFLLPAAVAKDVENDGWIVPIAAGLLNILLLYIMTRPLKEFCKYGFVGTIIKVFGRWLGHVLLLPFAVYLLVLCGSVSRLLSEVTLIFLLPHTPLSAIVIPVIVLATFSARAGIESMSRLFEAIFPFTLIIFLAIVLLIIPGSDLSNLRPFFTHPFSAFLKSIPNTVYAYTGFELLIFLYPFMRQPKKAFKFATVAMVLLIVIYTTMMTLSLVRMGSDRTQRLTFNVISLVKASEAPNTFIERFEGAILALWIVLEFTSLCIFLFSSSVFFGDIFHQKQGKHLLAIGMPLVYLIALVEGKDLSSFLHNIDRITFFVYPFVGLFIPLLLIIAIAIKRKVTKREI